MRGKNKEEIGQLPYPRESSFPHKKVHKATWRSPDNVAKNQIDHICIARKFKQSLSDVRVRRGADAGSDHHLLVAAMKLKRSYA